MDRLDKIIAGITAAGEGTFTITLVGPDSRFAGEWAVSAEYGRENDDSPMAGASSMAMSVDPQAAVASILAETRWAELS